VSDRKELRKTGLRRTGSNEISATTLAAGAPAAVTLAEPEIPTGSEAGELELSWTESGALSPVVVASMAQDRRAEGRTSCWEGEEMSDGPNPILRKALEHEPGESP
jgi:hypothetical protein